MERRRIEEEKEEMRVAEQRACIQREYEEEQRKQKKVKVSLHLWWTALMFPHSEGSLLTLGLQITKSFPYLLQHRLENHSWIHEPKTQHQEEKKGARQDQEVEKRVSESAEDKGDKSREGNYEVE